jgi:hypothetical protein
MSATIISITDRARPSRPPHVPFHIGNGSSSERVANARGECEERKRRRDVWRAADATREFYESVFRLAHAASCAARAGLSEAKLYAHLDQDYNDKPRTAIAAQLLTPAPTAAALNWKKAARASDSFDYLPVSAEAVDRSIASDEAWLKANAPVRRKASAEAN